jgi:hypothetical protein
LRRRLAEEGGTLKISSLLCRAATSALAGSLVALAAGGMAFADEGMWTFDNFPAAAVKAKYGVTVDQAWLDRVRANAVRLSTGCSASVVSGQGLVFTNHHCVRDCAQQLSTPSKDYVKDGFSAARAEERLCPGMQAEILTRISDVTERINGATAGTTGQGFIKARDAAMGTIEKEGCVGREEKFRCQVISLYEGGQYKLYEYRKYSDVRLVFAPEEQTAAFGGDPDNFNFPRYDLDCSFVRLYENGKPVATPDHLRWNPAPPKTGEPVFVAGNPGSTQRLLTADQLETLRDVQLPDILMRFSELRGRLIRFGEESPEHARIADSTLLRVENSFKALSGEELTLSDPPFIEAKRGVDQALRSRVAADPKLAAAIGDPWAEIAALQADRRAINAAYTLTESQAGLLSELFTFGRRIVRAAEEREKPSADRLPEYSDSRLALLRKTVLDEQTVYPDLEEAALEFWLSKLREKLTADAPETKAFLGKESPRSLAISLAGSRLADAAYRKSLWDGGLAAVQASDDPMIKFVLATDPTSRAARKDFEQKISGPSDRASERIARARFAIYGVGAYPDATFSARITYGAVAGWTDQGRVTPPFTYFRGLWDRATGEPPFDLAPRWVAAKGRLNDDTVFDFTANTDITGGNSGSPVINARGEVIGAAFDGNIESLGGAFAFDPAVNRTVVVSTAAITEALRQVYQASDLAAELAAD